MAIFQSTQQLYDVLQEVFVAVAANPANVDSFTHSNLVVRMTTEDPPAAVLLDGRQPPLEVFYGERPGKANIEITLPADLLHAIWTDQASASESFFSGKIKTKGNLLKAMHLVELFRECERVYPAIAKAHGLIG
jgi:alkyl sulfatase BDS1-like metallo-beta-lactamase superfamily hydrolase